MVHEPPRSVTADQVLSQVRSLWDSRVVGVQHLAVGFGAWHWRADVPGGDGHPQPGYFVSLDPPWWHSAATLEATYAAAASLGETLAFVHPCVRTSTGRFTSRAGDGSLSLTSWVPGHRPGSLGPEAVRALADLHASRPPEGILTWEPSVGPDLVDHLSEWTRSAWTDGPLGEAARDAVRAGAADVRRGLADYLRLVERLDPHTYVPTHGEPGVHNLWRADDGRLLLLDWETLRLAPPERDVVAGYASAIPHDPALLHLFRLEWQLGEVGSYSAWLRGPHDDDEDTRTALGGLRAELDGLRTSTIRSRRAEGNA
ncbi:hypothetical protein AVL62_06240 [Serinicoccus chungangensis]|uniref:Aminoglycoside phosphotransferase domain-containing protein n=1 Tax=Serinicoccus chungangensis TaxID=767452 RepID=A0A0W8IH09_9MICO|nr:hypothetical protein AVL62_06240 [Serinicoccus chungangensis]